VAAVSAGTWYTSPDRSSPALANYIVSRGTNVTLGNGQAALQNFTAHLATNHISGLLLDVSNNPVANVGIYGFATINGTTYNQYVDTGTNGSFRFAVADGSWTVGANCSGGGDTLSALKFQCVNDVKVNIAGADVATNFIVQPCGALQVTTASPLISGRETVYYEVILQAAGGNQPFTWALAPGSQQLPAGLVLGPDGTLSGYPTASGTFSFTARVTDGSGNHADQAFSVTIAPAPLQVVTASLPAGGTGYGYSQQLSASGGQPPYSWSVTPGMGSLPQGMSLGAGGLLSGIPTIYATYYFDITVTDAAGTNADQSFSLNITNSPLVVTTTSLPNATVGLPYNAQLAAAGGRPPYTWDVVAPAILPSGILLSQAGLMSGTPDTPGSYNFTVVVTDYNSVTATQSLGMLIGSGLVLGTPTLSANGQFQFQVQGTLGQTYTVEFSADLKTWSPVQTLTAPSGLFMITVGAPAGHAGFYRLKVGL